MGENPNQTVLIAKNLVKKFNDKPVFTDLSLNFSSYGLTGISGVSGSGKTTLLNCLSLLEPIDSGEILFNGKRIDNLSRAKKSLLYRKKFGFVFQNYGLVDSLSVSDNLDFSLRYSKLNREEKKARKFFALEQVSLSSKAKSLVYELSGGEQQRVALAKLILKSPNIIFCDEPSSSLDSDNTLNTIRILKETFQNSIILISTHDPLVLENCDTIIRLDKLEK